MKRSVNKGCLIVDRLGAHPPVPGAPGRQLDVALLDLVLHGVERPVQHVLGVPGADAEAEAAAQSTRSGVAATHDGDTPERGFI